MVEDVLPPHPHLRQGFFMRVVPSQYGLGCLVEAGALAPSARNVKFPFTSKHGSAQSQKRSFRKRCVTSAAAGSAGFPSMRFLYILKETSTATPFISPAGGFSDHLSGPKHMRACPGRGDWSDGPREDIRSPVPCVFLVAFDMLLTPLGPSSQQQTFITHLHVW